MKNFSILLSLLLLVCSIGVGYWFTRSVIQAPTASTWTQSVDTVMPPTVSIVATSQSGTVDTSISGTGIIVSSNGLIVTSKHLVWENFWYMITLHDGSTFPAELVKTHRDKDLAILRPIWTKQTSFSVGTFIDSQASVQVWQKVIAIGNMLGLYPFSVVDGIISWMNRSVSFWSIEMTGLLQTSIPATMGNSGWPLVRDDGIIIGINVGIVSGSSQISWTLPLTQQEVDDFIKS